MKEGGNFVNPISNDIPHGLEGLSKREYFAGLAMQAIVSREVPKDGISADRIVSDAVVYADLLLQELEKPKQI
jgi:hypothetical protein